VTVRELGDVDQALDAVGDLDEGAEGHELGDLAVDDLAHLVLAGELLPRVLLGGLQRQRDALALEVHVQHLDVHLVADLDDLGGVVDVLPGQLGDVHEPVDAAEVHEGTEVDDAGDHTAPDLALLQGGEELVAELALGLLEELAPREDDVVAVLVELDDLALELLAHVGVEVAHPAHLDQRGGQEAAQPDVEDEPALDHLDDGALDGLVLLVDPLDGPPGALVLGALLGQDETTLVVLLVHHQRFDHVPDLDDLVGVHVELDRQLTGRDDALGLPADVEQHLVGVDLDDDPFDELALIHGAQRALEGGLELVVGDVVLDDLLAGRGHAAAGVVHQDERVGRALGFAGPVGGGLGVGGVLGAGVVLGVGGIGHRGRFSSVGGLGVRTAAAAFDERHRDAPAGDEQCPDSGEAGPRRATAPSWHLRTSGKGRSPSPRCQCAGGAPRGCTP
jgi:hypothetical protein